MFRRRGCANQLGPRLQIQAICIGDIMVILQLRTLRIFVFPFLLALVSFTGPVSAQTVTTTVPAGTGPWAVAVNPVTNRIYVANYDNNSVTVIDGATNSTTTVAAGEYPIAVAVNPATNRIYVANYNSNDVTVIDGATNTTTT